MAFYHDQHLAWQQRVSKEITAASRFYSHYRQLPKFSSTPNSVIAKPIVSKNLNKQFYQTLDSQHPGPYAEVRGKYARPPPLMQKSNLIQSLAPKENFLISRPSTSGSLKPRNASIKNPVCAENKDVSQELSPIRERIIKYRSTSTKARDHDTSSDSPVKQRIQVKKDEKKQDDCDKQEGNGEGEKIEETAADDHQPDQDLEEEEEGKVYENQDDYLRDGLSYVSGLTTSSQRRYIMELETLLREEKLKRIQLEDSLKKIMDDNK
ncbi:hypothetical protein SteCoe_12530 [Stentor coeruleus]|uniref:Uncharacterized protein n=1 Tax=Stentor coeruleus TaxID=5963 RepID=A0A1R2CAJ7_9CILI|nr:hypothetical protein SteCoe_12530 [Stentor coeruleus]